MFLYSVFIFCAISVFNFSMNTISTVLLCLGIAAFIVNIETNARYAPLFMCVVAIVLRFTDADVVLRFYPIGVISVCLCLFGSSLFQKETIIFKFASILDRSIKTHPGRADIEKYCRHVTEVWVSWFIINLFIAFYFVFFGSIEKWTIFNGPVCWFVQGMIFLVEFLVRYKVNNRIAVKYNLPEQSFKEFCKIYKRNPDTKKESAGEVVV